MLQRMWQSIRRTLRLLFGVLQQQRTVDVEFERALKEAENSKLVLHAARVKLQKASANVHARASTLAGRAGENDVEGERAHQVATAEAR